MNLQFWRKPEERAADAGNAAVAAIVAAARGQTADGDGTAAAVATIGLIGRLFAAATIDPPMFAHVLTPAALQDIARRLMISGNAVYQLAYENGHPLFGPVGSFAVVGGGLNPDGWVYDLDLPTPAGTLRRRELGAGLIHVRYNAPAGAPWRGTAPLADAGLSAAQLANIERRLGEEANTRVGSLLTYPDGSSDATINGVRSDLGVMQGGVMLIETGAAGLRAGLPNASPTDWRKLRLGAEIPESSLELARDAADRVMSALGLSGKYWSGQGVDQREAARQLHHTVLLPMARLVSAELSAKLNRPITLNLDGDGLIELQQRSRSAMNLVQAGMALADALATVGMPYKTAADVGITVESPALETRPMLDSAR